MTFLCSSRSRVSPGKTQLLRVLMAGEWDNLEISSLTCPEFEASSFLATYTWFLLIIWASSQNGGLSPITQQLKAPKFGILIGQVRNACHVYDLACEIKSYYFFCTQLIKFQGRRQIPLEKMSRSHCKRSLWDLWDLTFYCGHLYKNKTCHTKSASMRGNTYF